jgi:phosphoribosylanthranilate isomerase
MTLIKICGLTSILDAMETAQMDVQIIGLVFAESRRRVSLQQAAEICTAVKELPRHPLLAGVFVNETPHTVNETARQCGLDLVQLSGDESSDYCSLINAPVIKAIHISPSSHSEDIAVAISGNTPSGRRIMYLLDAKEEGKYGGTGQNFDWNIAAEISASYPVMIAGGLNPQNVGSMVKSVRPLGVDVSSGVETDGRKDISRVQSFIEAVRAVDKPADKNSDLLNKYILKR